MYVRDYRAITDKWHHHHRPTWSHKDASGSQQVHNPGQIRLINGRTHIDTIKEDRRLEMIGVPGNDFEGSEGKLGFRLPPGHGRLAMCHGRGIDFDRHDATLWAQVLHHAGEVPGSGP